MRTRLAQIFLRKGLLLLWPSSILGGVLGLCHTSPVIASTVASATSRTVQSGFFTLPDTLRPWFGGVRYEREFISRGRPEWTDWVQVQGFLVRDFQSGAWGVEVAQVERFGLTDEIVVLDGYRNLWSRAYANLWVRLNPKADVLPNADVRAEFFQAFESGWEISGSYWRLDLDLDDVNVLGAGLAKYHGNWYLRQVTNVSWLAGESALSLSFAARRLLNPPREYVELSGGIGEEAVVSGPGPTVDVRQTRFVRVSVQRFFSTHWGYSAAAMYNLFEGAPERWGLMVGLLTRF